MKLISILLALTFSLGAHASSSAIQALGANPGATVLDAILTSGSFSSGSTATVVYSTVRKDSAAAYNSSTGIWTAPRNADLNIAAQVGTDGSFSSGNAAVINVVQNTGGSDTIRCHNRVLAALNGTGANWVPVNCQLHVVTGDQIRITYVNAASGQTVMEGSTGSTYFTITEANATVAASGASSVSRVSGAGGNGSTATKVRYFSSVVTSPGSDMSYASSSVNGDSWTINVAGNYAITYCDASASNLNLAITDNQTSLTTNPYSLSPYSQVLALGTSAGGDLSQCVSWSGPLAATHVIRAASDQSSTGVAPGRAIFSIAHIN